MNFTLVDVFNGLGRRGKIGIAPAQGVMAHVSRMARSRPVREFPRTFFVPLRRGRSLFFRGVTASDPEATA